MFIRLAGKTMPPGSEKFQMASAGLSTAKITSFLTRSSSNQDSGLGAPRYNKQTKWMMTNNSLRVPLTEISWSSTEVLTLLTWKKILNGGF